MGHGVLSHLLLIKFDQVLDELMTDLMLQVYRLDDGAVAARDSADPPMELMLQLNRPVQRVIWTSMCFSNLINKRFTKCNRVYGCLGDSVDPTAELMLQVIRSDLTSHVRPARLMRYVWCQFQTSRLPD